MFSCFVEKITEVVQAGDRGSVSVIEHGGVLPQTAKQDGSFDIKHIPELMALRFAEDGTLEIGAAKPLAEIYEDPEVARRLPGLVDAAGLIGGIQVQSRASLGGNLCNASPAADASPALMVLGARLVIGSATGTREVPVEEFFLGPGKHWTQDIPRLPVEGKFTGPQALAAMHGHILAEESIVGIYTLNPAL